MVLLDSFLLVFILYIGTTGHSVNMHGLRELDVSHKKMHVRDLFIKEKALLYLLHIKKAYEM